MDLDPVAYVPGNAILLFAQAALMRLPGVTLYVLSEPLTRIVAIDGNDEHPLPRTRRYTHFLTWNMATIGTGRRQTCYVAFGTGTNPTEGSLADVELVAGALDTHGTSAGRLLGAAQQHLLGELSAWKLELVADAQGRLRQNYSFELRTKPQHLQTVLEQAELPIAGAPPGSTRYIYASALGGTLTATVMHFLMTRAATH